MTHALFSYLTSLHIIHKNDREAEKAAVSCCGRPPSLWRQSKWWPLTHLCLPNTHTCTGSHPSFIPEIRPQIVFYTQCGWQPPSVHEERAGPPVCQAGHHSQEKQPSLSHCHLEKPALLCRPLQRIKPQAHENMMTVPCIGKIKPPDTGGVFKSFWHSLGPHLTCQLARCLCQSTVCGKTWKRATNMQYTMYG